MAGGATSLAWNHTVSSNSGRVLLAGSGNGQTPKAYSGGVFNTTETMTELWDAVDSLAIGQACQYILANPSSGTHQVSLTVGAVSDFGCANSVDFSGGDPDGTMNGTPVTAQDASITVTTATGEIIVDAITAFGNPITVGANQTSKYQVNGANGGSSSFGISSQNGVDGGVMSWTGTSFFIIGGVSIKAGSAAAAAPPTRQQQFFMRR